MLRPDSRDLLVGGKFTAQNLGVCFCKVGVFFRGQLDRWLIHTGKLQQNAGKFVLHVVGKGRDRFHGLFKQSRHARNIVVFAFFRKHSGSLKTGTPHISKSIYGFPIAIAIAAARNGNGSDTAARNQTKRAGMNGISQRISRWKANSAQAIT